MSEKGQSNDIPVRKLVVRIENGTSKLILYVEGSDRELTLTGGGMFGTEVIEVVRIKRPEEYTEAEKKFSDLTEKLFGKHSLSKDEVNP